jgi:imidazolonepropionase-like amidohydrolase
MMSTCYHCAMHTEPVRNRVGRVALAFLLIVACSGDPTGPVPTPRARTALPPLFPGAVAIVGANVVTMADDGVLVDQTVIVRDGLVSAVGPRESIAVPPDAERVDARGAYLLPGLIDAHVHLLRADADAYLRAGVTTVRNMWGTPGVAALRAEAAAGAPLPTIFSAGPGIDGNPPAWPYTELPASPAEAADIVTRHVAEGWDFIKVYDRLSPAAYDAVTRRARELGVAVIGHVPRAIPLDQAFDRGQASIEHLTGYALAVGGWTTPDRGRFGPLAGATAERGVWNCPTLLVVAALSGQRAPAESVAVVRNRRALVRALYDAGAPLLAGTDAGIDVVPPGSALAGELEELVAAGLPPAAALRAATVNPARFLGVTAELGTVEVGKRADLVLLHGDPLADISRVRAPLGVVLRGRWLNYGPRLSALGARLGR